MLIKRDWRREVKVMEAQPQAAVSAVAAHTAATIRKIGVDAQLALMAIV